MPRIRILTSLVLFWAACSGFPAAAQINVTGVSMQLAPIAPGSNLLDLELDAGFFVGSDTAQSELSGAYLADFVMTPLPGSGFEATGFSISGGDVSLSDVTFDLLITARSMGMGGTPYTVGGTSAITAGSFNGADHQFEVNRGTVSAAGSVFDFSAEPITAPGQGTGSVALTAGSPTVGFDVYDIQNGTKQLKNSR